MTNRDAHEANRRSWNTATRAHNSHKRDQAGFLRGGGSTLYPEEVALLGELRGKTLVHLQCNSGQDTLSIASKLGASVTGVDISDEAIAFARRLSKDAGIPGSFIRADVYDWFTENTQQYDVAFCSYGALMWLSDIGAWAKGVAGVLAPGGRLVLVEFHPLLSTLGDDLSLEYDYMNGTHITFEDGVGDYVGASGEVLAPSGFEPGERDFSNPHPSHEFMWGLGDVLSAVIAAGLRITHMQEYPYCNGYFAGPEMRALPGGRYVLPERLPTLPLMWSLIAQKDADHD